MTAGLLQRVLWSAPGCRRLLCPSVTGGSDGCTRSLLPYRWARVRWPLLPPSRLRELQVVAATTSNSENQRGACVGITAALMRSTGPRPHRRQAPAGSGVRPCVYQSCKWLGLRLRFARRHRWNSDARLPGSSRRRCRHHPRCHPRSINSPPSSAPRPEHPEWSPSHDQHERAGERLPWNRALYSAWLAASLRASVAASPWPQRYGRASCATPRRGCLGITGGSWNETGFCEGCASARGNKVAGRSPQAHRSEALRSRAGL